MPDGFKEVALEQFRDLAEALIILLKDTIFALAVFLVGRFIGFCIHQLSATGDMTAGAVRYISDVWSIILFVVLVARDLWNYIKKP